MTYCTNCGKPTNNWLMCEDCIISNSPWLLSMKNKEDDLVEQIEQLKAENAKLKDQWDNLRCVYSFDGDVMEYCVNGPCPHDRSVAKVREENDELKERLSQANEECLKWHERAQNLIKENCGSIFGYEKTIKELQSENAALRERLSKAVELPVPLGTPILKVWKNRVPEDDARMSFVDVWEITTVNFKLEHYPLWGKYCFPKGEEGRKAAEARCAELKGEVNG